MRKSNTNTFNPELVKSVLLANKQEDLLKHLALIVAFGLDTPEYHKGQEVIAEVLKTNYNIDREGYSWEESSRSYGYAPCIVEGFDPLKVKNRYTLSYINKNKERKYFHTDSLNEKKSELIYTSPIKTEVQTNEEEVEASVSNIEDVSKAS